MEKPEAAGQTPGYRGLIACQRSMDFAESVYRLSSKFPPDERLGLTNQVRRAGNSVPANTAEGRGKGSPADCVRFLAISRGSLFEVERYPYLAQRFGYAWNDEVETLIAESSKIAKLISGLIRQRRSR